MKNKYPFITVVMPVRNEEKFIEATLKNLIEQNYPSNRYEIIVADGKSTDRTSDVVRKLSQKFPQIKLKDNPGRFPSLGRNVGFKSGKGDYYLVIDGHCVIENKNLLRNIAELFQKTGVACLGRPQPFITPKEPTWQRVIAIARSSKLGHSRNSYIHCDKEGYVSPVSMGCAYKRDVFQKIGYVDESFDAAEDVEFNYRVEQAGFKTYFSPKIAVSYFPRENLKGLMKQLSRYGEGRAKFILKYPVTFNIEILLPILFVLAMLLGPLTILIHQFLLYGYLFVLGTYLLLVIWESRRLRTNEPFLFIFKLFMVFITIHFSIGIGFIGGFVKNWLKNLFKKSR